VSSASNGWTPRTKAKLNDSTPCEHELFGRGFARPRLWEQYAGNHVGVCLCFRRDRLIAAVQRAVDGTDEILSHGPVNYRDGEIAVHASNLDLQTAAREGPDVLIAQHIADHREELLFTKLKDWATESEYRFITQWRSSDDLFVDVSQCLEVVPLGHAIARAYAPSFYALCEPRGIAVAKVEWRNGRPVVYKAARDPKLG
jgi:hypothetical protein